jgi:CubicO group peptidase (beta-lactamase class C family)
MNVSSKRLFPRLQPDTRLLLDRTFEKAISEGVFSGAQMLVAVQGCPFISETWGSTRAEGDPVSPSTRFDLASLTKPLVTAPLALTAVARGIMRLDDPLERFFPADLIGPEKREITIRHLLSHSSGLPAYKPFYLDLIQFPCDKRRNELLSMILETPLDSAPGKAAVYSDLGYMILGFILERLFGAGLDRLAEDILFGPLAVDELHFCRLETGGAPNVPTAPAAGFRGLSFASTEICPWRKRLLTGEVDDENAWCLSGVGGHAGLFGTASGVYAILSFLSSILDGRIRSVLWPEVLVRLFWTKTKIPENSPWCLGYDTPSMVNSSAGSHFSGNTIGHLGFTGTSFWVDLDREIVFILLTNRIHPSRQNEGIKSFRPLVHNIVMEALKNEIR